MRIAPPFVLAAVLLAAASVATAQPAAAPLPLFPPVQFEKLGLEDGLPQIHVTGVAQDTRGFLWIGTQAGGLARYDGHEMVHYSTEDAPTSLSSQFVTTVRAEASGRLWVGTGDAGLNLYDPATDKFTRFRHVDSDAGSIGLDAITALTFDAKGTLWIGLANGGLDRFDAATKKFQHIISPATPSGEVTGIQISEDVIYVASNGAGVQVVRGAQGTPAVTPLALGDSISKNVTAILADKAGTLWVGTEDAGLLQIPRGATAPIVHQSRVGDRGTLSSDKVTSLYEDADKNLWVGTQFGLNMFDAERKRITRYAPDGEYPLRTATYLQFVTTLFEDKSGILWFGTLDFGLYKLEPLRRAFRNYTATAEFGIPMAFCDGADGKIWAGTYSHGLYGFDFATDTYVAYPTLGPSGDQEAVTLTNWLTSVHCAKDGTIWIGGSGLGLVSFDPATQRYTQYPVDPDGLAGPSSDRIEQILEGPDGALWLAGWGGGLSRFDPKTKTFNQVLVAPSYLHRILFDTKDPNILWVGAAQGGIARFDIRAKTSTFVRGPGAGKAGGPALSNDSVLSLYQEPSGVLWIGTDGGGLDRYDPAAKTVASYTRKDGLTSDVIYGIVPDTVERLWLTTARGLIQFDMTTHNSVTYTSADGLGSTEFSQNSYFKSKTGEIFVGTLVGFNRFDPKAIVPDKYVPPAVLTEFRLFDKEPDLAKQIWDTQRLELSYRDSVFSVEFASLAFAAPKQTRYQYMLEGFRNEWVTTERGEVTFTNLDAGNYVLKVRAINRHGVVSDPPTTLAIHIEPPIWRSKPAYVLYAVLVLAAIILTVRIQRERLRRVVREGRLALVENELALTGAVQSGFLPANNEIASKQMRLVGYYKPADQCSGDWWWHAQLDDWRHLILVGDVTGHGPGPAMVTAAVATAFHVVSSTMPDIEVEQMLELLNREVHRVAKGKYQMALAALEIDETTGAWKMHSAGAPPMITLDTHGKHRVHFCPGSFLGTEGEFETGQTRGTLAPGERILLYTDGIPEMQLADGNVLGIRKFGQIYEKTRTQTVAEASNTIASFAEQQLGGREQLDDWTFAMVEWKQTQAAS